MDSQTDWLDTLMRVTLRAGVAGQAPSPQVWERIAARAQHKRAFEAAFAPEKGCEQLAPADYYPRLLPPHAGEIVMAFALRFSN
jgi:hypothetical protein